MSLSILNLIKDITIQYMQLDFKKKTSELDLFSAKQWFKKEKDKR